MIMNTILTKVILVCRFKSIILFSQNNKTSACYKYKRFPKISQYFGVLLALSNLTKMLVTINGNCGLIILVPT